MEAPDLEGPLASVSYTPFEGISRAPNGPVRKILAADDPSYRNIRDQIRADLRAIAPYTNTVRTYSSTMGEEFPST